MPPIVKNLFKLFLRFLEKKVCIIFLFYYNENYNENYNTIKIWKNKMFKKYICV